VWIKKDGTTLKGLCVTGIWRENIFGEGKGGEEQGTDSNNYDTRKGMRIGSVVFGGQQQGNTARTRFGNFTITDAVKGIQM